MTNRPRNNYSAFDAALGYLYQVRSALLWTLKKLKANPDFLVGIETLDDVAFETTKGDPRELLQLKHHRNGVGSLTDASPDLWKTLRIWFEGRASGTIPTTANLCLVTTGIACKGDAPFYLRTESRDVEAAIERLNAVAQSSTNSTNQPAYKAYLDADSTERKALLDTVTVFDAYPTINDLDGELQQELLWNAGRDHCAAFLERLEGWWFRRVLRQLTNAKSDRIGSAEVESQMSDLREGFKREALPIDDDLLDFTLDEAVRLAHENSNFVRQMDLVNAGKRRIALAIRDYYRAFEQRSRWLRDELIVSRDLRTCLQSHEDRRLCPSGGQSDEVSQ